MPRPKINDGLTKAQRFRQRQSHKGMKLLRVWVPDTTTPEFAAEMERQALLLAAQHAEIEGDLPPCNRGQP